ncbi:ERF family protein (plasmid) [Borreliella sinica]|uniref:ERF family protein n=1 Tax=Borreliella sinica TaxID=87162 RepID=UPI003AF169C5
MNNVSKNNNFNIQDNIQAKIKFRKDMKTLRMNLPGIDKSLNGYGYKYQNFNDIAKEIKNVIKNHNLDLDFEQFPTFTHDPYGRVHVIRTTFYSTSTDYEFSFDTPILTENLQWNSENGSKNINTAPQFVGSAITYFKRYALVAYLVIESEVDTDAAPIYNNSYENENSISNRQVSVNRKQEQKQVINQNQKNERYYNQKTNNSEQKKDTIQVQKRDINLEQRKERRRYFGIFKEALSNIKDCVNDATIQDKLNIIIQKIDFMQKIDPNNINDIKTIEGDILKHFEQNSNLRNMDYWTSLIKEYLKKNNKIDDINRFEAFMAFKQRLYEKSILKFFLILKEEETFNYIFAS